MRKALPIWAMPKGSFRRDAVRTLAKLDEDALGCFGAEVYLMGGVLDGSHEGLEHQAELAGVGEFTTAVGAHLRLDLVFAEALVALAALDEGVAEAGDVAAGDPHLGVHEDGGVQAHHVVALLHHGTPPEVLEVALEFHAQGAVVPGGVDTAVNLTALEDQPTALGQGENLVHLGSLYITAHQFALTAMLECVPRLASCHMGVNVAWSYRSHDCI